MSPSVNDEIKSIVSEFPEYSLYCAFAILLRCQNLHFHNPVPWKLPRGPCEKPTCIDAHYAKYRPQCIAFALFVIGKNVSYYPQYKAYLKVGIYIKKNNCLPYNVECLMG